MISSSPQPALHSATSDQRTSLVVAGRGELQLAARRLAAQNRVGRMPYTIMTGIIAEMNLPYSAKNSFQVMVAPRVDKTIGVRPAGRHWLRRHWSAATENSE